MRVELFRIPDKSIHWYAAWYAVRHIKTKIGFPLVFEFEKDASAAAGQIDALCDWDAYVDTWDDGKREEMASDLHRNMFSIADENNGALLPGQPLDHQKIALMKRGAEA